MATKTTFTKAEWISRMGKELEGLVERPKAKIHIDSLRTTLKNTKLENARLRWYTWILVQKIILHP